MTISKIMDLKIRGRATAAKCLRSSNSSSFSFYRGLYSNPLLCQLSWSLCTGLLRRSYVCAVTANVLLFGLLWVDSFAATRIAVAFASEGGHGVRRKGVPNAFFPNN